MSPASAGLDRFRVTPQRSRDRRGHGDHDIRPGREHKPLRELDHPVIVESNSKGVDLDDPGLPIEATDQCCSARERQADLGPTQTEAEEARRVGGRCAPTGGATHLARRAEPAPRMPGPIDSEAGANRRLGNPVRIFSVGLEL